MEKTKEYIEELTLLKTSSFEDKSYYIFQNANGEFCTLESDKFPDIALQPGSVLKVRMRRKGCAGREITELVMI